MTISKISKYKGMFSSGEKNDSRIKNVEFSGKPINTETEEPRELQTEWMTYLAPISWATLQAGNWRYDCPTHASCLSADSIVPSSSSLPAIDIFLLRENNNPKQQQYMVNRDPTTRMARRRVLLLRDLVSSVSVLRIGCRQLSDANLSVSKIGSQRLTTCHLQLWSNRRCSCNSSSLDSVP